jgi:hypothetical protein
MTGKEPFDQILKKADLELTDSENNSVSGALDLISSL